MFELAARLIAFFYSGTHNYAIAIGLVAVVVMLIITPLTLKSTRGMLEMQKLQPEMRRLQAEFRGDRQKLNEAMMKLYQERKINPLASCLPLLAQMPVFIIMFRALHGLIREVDGKFSPQYLSTTSELYQSLVGKSEMLSFGIDLAVRPVDAVRDNFWSGLIYVGLVVALAGVYWIQQRMVASRTVSPTMSATQAKILQYMPVAFAFFQLILPTALIVYYITQALIRIGQQYYITKRFYGGENSLGRQAQAAGAQAREIAAEEKKSKKDSPKTDPNQPFVSKRVTPPKGAASKRPTPPGKNRSASVQRKKK